MSLDLPRPDENRSNRSTPPAAAAPARRRRLSRTAVVLVSLLLVLGGIGLIYTPEVVALFDRLFDASERGSIAELEKNFDHPFSDDEKLMYGLSHFSDENADEAVTAIQQSGDARFIPVLIEMLRANELLIAAGAGGQKHWDALKHLSGQSMTPETDNWITWYGTTDIKPPAGFTSWKGQLFARLDPRMVVFLDDKHPSKIRVEEIQYGGVKVDGIPPLNDPQMQAAAEADYLYPHEPVVGITVNGESRAYPLRIIDWHEMVNDTIGGSPVSLAYCTLCGAAIAYAGRDAEGETCRFGTSGLLYRSNKLMYDRRTKTLWNQFTGEPVLGPQASHEFRLDKLPCVVAKWADWQADHPDTLVLSRATGHARDYSEPGRAYGTYFAFSGTMFAVPNQSDALPAKSRVYGVEQDGVRKAYPLELITNERVINDHVGKTPLVLVAPRGPVRVLGTTAIGETYDYLAGIEVRAFERGSRVFSAGSDVNTVVDESGNAWRVSERGLENAEGTLLPRIQGTLAYWFGWHAFHSDTQVYSKDVTPTTGSSDAAE